MPQVHTVYSEDELSFDRIPQHPRRVQKCFQVFCVTALVFMVVSAIVLFSVFFALVGSTSVDLASAETALFVIHDRLFAKPLHDHVLPVFGTIEYLAKGIQGSNSSLDTSTLPSLSPLNPPRLPHAAFHRGVSASPRYDVASLRSTPASQSLPTQTYSATTASAVSIYILTSVPPRTPWEWDLTYRATHKGSHSFYMLSNSTVTVSVASLNYNTDTNTISFSLSLVANSRSAKVKKTIFSKDCANVADCNAVIKVNQDGNYLVSVVSQRNDDELEATLHQAGYRYSTPESSAVMSSCQISAEDGCYLEMKHSKKRAVEPKERYILVLMPNFNNTSAQPSVDSNIIHLKGKARAGSVFFFAVVPDMALCPLVVVILVLMMLCQGDPQKEVMEEVEPEVKSKSWAHILLGTPDYYQEGEEEKEELVYSTYF